MRFRVFLGICVCFIVVAASILLARSSGRLQAGGDKKRGPYRLYEIKVHRAYSLNAKEDKALTSTKDEVFKSHPGKLEIGLSGKWYTQRTTLTVTGVPESVEDGQSVTINATADTVADLQLERPGQYDLYVNVNVMFQTTSENGLPGTAAKPTPGGTHRAVGFQEPHSYRWQGPNAGFPSWLEKDGVRYAHFRVQSKSGIPRGLRDDHGDRLDIPSGPGGQARSQSWADRGIGRPLEVACRRRGMADHQAGRSLSGSSRQGSRFSAKARL